jgi:hypothetical protein
MGGWGYGVYRFRPHPLFPLSQYWARGKRDKGLKFPFSQIWEKGLGDVAFCASLWVGVSHWMRISELVYMGKMSSPSPLIPVELAIRWSLN